MKPSNNAALRISDAEHILLILDYDGTLSPIADRPDEATLPPESKKTLNHLADLPCLNVCIMSGRPLDDLKERVGVPGLIYVGSHGLEAEGIEYEVPKADLEGIRNSMNEFLREAERTIPKLDGLIIENKGFAIGIHYRLVAVDDVAQISRAIGKLMPHFPEALLTFGKKVFEIRPAVKWDKGTMATTLLNELRTSHPGCEILPIYIGDDTTDEDAFEALSKTGITILVSDDQRASKAQYRVRGTKDVLIIIRELGTFLNCRTAGQMNGEGRLKAWARLKSK